MAAGDYGLVVVFVAALVAAGYLLAEPGRLPPGLIPLGLCALAGFHALMRWFAHGPLFRHNVLRTHGEELVTQKDPADIAPDGRILATGEIERALRVLAAGAAVLSCAWPIAMAATLPKRLAAGVDGVFGPLLLLLFAGVTVAQLIGRARGKIVLARPGRRSPREVWSWTAFVTVLFAAGLRWNEGTLHRALLVVAGLSLALVAAGWWFEGRRLRT
jgi:hypothetical protein